jgi:hypothetical protein
LQYLKAFNFQNDLSRSTGSLADMALQTTVTASGAVPQIDLPKSSRTCLMSIYFYEVGFEAAEVATVAIAQRFCTSDVEASELLIKLVCTLLLSKLHIINDLSQALRRLQHIVKDWTWNPAETVITGFLRVLIKINDGFHVDRIEEMIGGEYGLLTGIVNER